MRKLSVPLGMLSLAVVAAASSASAEDRGWRTYTQDAGEALVLEVPVTWREEIRKADPGLPATIVLRPGEGEDLEVLVTPIPAQGGRLPPMADLEAGLIQLGTQRLSTSRQTSVTLERLEGQEATGRYFLLTEKQTPPGEYSSVIGGGLLTGSLVVSFTILLNVPGGDDAREALRILQSARSQARGAVPARSLLPIPGQGWFIAFEAPPLTKLDEALDVDQYMYSAGSGRFNLSVFVETPGCEGGSEHTDFYACFWPRAKRNPQIVESSVVATNTAQYFKVTYDTVTPWQGKLITLSHVNFLIAYRGKWTDIHISVVEPTEEDGALLAAFESSLSYGE